MAQHETQALSVLNFMRNHGHRLLVETFHRAEPSMDGAPRRSARFL